MDDEEKAPPPARQRWADHLRRRLRAFDDDLMVAATILLALVLFMLPSIIVTIPAGHVGVIWKRFAGGTVPDVVLAEGTSLIMPWDHVFVYDARLQKVERDIEVLSSDGLKITLNLVWHFRILPQMAPRLHQYVGPEYAESMLAPTVGARTRDIIAVYQPDEVYTERRMKIQNQILESVRYDLQENFNSPLRGVREQWVHFEDILIRGMTLPPGVQEAIVRKNAMFHEMEEYTFRVQREQKEAERKRIEAVGIRNFQEIVSNGMSDSYLRWRGIEATLELARSPNTKVVVVGSGRSGLPLILNTEGETRTNAEPRSTAPAAAAEAPAAARPSRGGR
jgi:regulator of protease activity HflC (stomatin/prohibitin superfamily)